MDPTSFPTGASFLYERLGPDAGDTGIYLGSLDAKPEQQSSKRLLTSASSAVYAPAAGPGSSTGHLLFTREGSLMAQAFDLRRLELAGEAVPIAEGMGFGGPTPVFGLDDGRFSVSDRGVRRIRQSRSRNSPGSIGQGKCWQPPESRASTTPWLSRPTEPASR